ncbi:MAG: hypothetical protein K6A23_08845, partial [Butyrivibrio sp.]|nr:hypothetical protein [Butyrivibrio sp.]
MKKNFSYSAGAMVLTASMLAGCGSSALQKDGAEAITEASTAETTIETDDTTNETTTESSEADEIIQASGNPAGGYPWADTRLMENVTEGMETSAKDDFYLYSNYDWIMAGGDLEEEETDSELEIKEQILDIIENEDESDVYETELIRDYYNAFVDWDERNKLGTEPLRAVVEDIDSISSLKEMSEFITDEDRSRDVPMPINIHYYLNPDGSDIYCTYLSFIGYMDLLIEDSNEYTEETENGAKIKKAATEEIVYDLEGIGYTTEEATKIAEDFLAMETKLSAGLYSLSELLLRGPENQEFLFAEKSKVQEWMKDFPIEGLLESRGYGKAEQLLYENEEYIKLLGDVYNEENLELFKHYLISKYLLTSDYMCDKKAVELMIQTDNAKSGISSTYDDFDVTKYFMDQNLRDARDKAYLVRNDASTAKEEIIDLFNSLRESYIDMMQECDWISEESRANIIEKIESMGIYALYKDNWINYDSLNFKDKPFSEIAVELAHFNQDNAKKYAEGKVDNEVEAWNIWSVLEPNAKMIREQNKFL